MVERRSKRQESYFFCEFAEYKCHVMRQLTASQQRVVELWSQGFNVRVTAVPGAGKTTVMLDACSMASGICLILAYNRELCLDTKARIRQLNLDDWVTCMTFHGLAQYCVATCNDDIALLDIVDGLDAGTVRPARVLDRVHHVLIDEGQDFRPSFGRLIRHVVRIGAETQVMVVGDPLQMLYDYSDDDPADLTFLETPDLHFAQCTREWHTVALQESHRLTRSMTALVNGLFDTTIESHRDGPPVEVYTVNMWKAAFVLAEVLGREHKSECCILVSRKRNNGPLRATVNLLSSRGIRVYVHGEDGQDPRIRDHKLGVSTWYAAKGTERRVCVVFGFGADALDKPNPAYVGLTRSFERLVIIHDDGMPSQRLVETLRNIEGADSIIVDERTATLMRSTTWEADNPVPRTERTCLSLDGWRSTGSGRWIRDMFQCVDMNDDVRTEDDEDDGMVLVNQGCAQDCAESYRTAVLMRVEIESRGGKCRRLHDMMHTVRLSRDHQETAIRSGSHARFVPPNVPLSALIEPDVRRRIESLLRTQPDAWTMPDWCFLACAANAWYHFHHQLNQLAPYDWMDQTDFLARCARLRTWLSAFETLQFDVRLTKTVHTRLVHARCDVCAEEHAIVVVDSAVTHSDRTKASILAALHPNAACVLFNLRNGEQEHLYVEDADALLTRTLPSS